MRLYIRTRDGAQVTEDEALASSGALKDGYKVSGSVMMRDSAGNQINIQDAIGQVPAYMQPSLSQVLADLQSEWPTVRESGIYNGHKIAAELKTIADGHADQRLVQDANPESCATVVDHLYAQMAIARAQTTGATPAAEFLKMQDSRDTGQEAYENRISNAWRN